MSTLVSDRSCPRPSDQSAVVTSQARAAASKVLPNLQTILFSTNKPKISTTFKVSHFPPVLRLKERDLSASLD